jgi:hypothetical protein
MAELLDFASRARAIWHRSARTFFDRREVVERERVHARCPVGAISAGFAGFRWYYGPGVAGSGPDYFPLSALCPASGGGGSRKMVHRTRGAAIRGLGAGIRSPIDLSSPACANVESRRQSP